MVKAKITFLLLCMVGFTTILSVDSGIILKRIYHHRGASPAHNTLELGSIVFYFSGKPVIQRISSELISGNVQRNTYAIKGTRLNTEIVSILPIRTPHYAITMSDVGDAVHLVITYKVHTVMIDMSTFDSISLQKGVVIHFLNRVTCASGQKLKPSVEKNKQKTIVIDCGHGGRDAGAIGCLGIKEKDVVLSVGLRVAQLLKKVNMHVLFTRSSDMDVSLDERTSYANQHTADLFVSIHANASTNGSAHGIETFCMQSSSLHTESHVSDSVCSKALNEALSVRARASNSLAHAVHQSIITNVKKEYPCVVDRKVKYEVAQILLGSYMPAILIELGFVSHEEEAKRLRDQRYQDLLAQCICDGIIAYLKE